MTVRVSTWIPVLISLAIPAAAQETASLAQCAQVQPVVQRLLDDASARLEAARQTNNATALRAAVDDLDAALRDVRAQLAPCATVQPATDAHAGHTIPNVQGAPAAAPGTPAMAPGSTMPAPGAKAPAAPPPMDHSKMNMGTSAKPAAGAKPVPPTAKAPPVDHSKMNMGTTAKPAAGAKPVPPSAKAPPVDHSKMNMGTAKPAAPATGTKPASGTKPPGTPPPMDHSKMDMGTSAKPAAGKSSDPSAQATDPVCGLKVDPASAPAAKHNGQTYYFCSQQHQQLFQKNPAKFVPKEP